MSHDGVISPHQSCRGLVGQEGPRCVIFQALIGGDGEEEMGLLSVDDGRDRSGTVKTKVIIEEKIKLYKKKELGMEEKMSGSGKNIND